MKVISYKVLEDCVERGIGYGYMRAYKHNDKPTEEYIKEQLQYYVMLEISDYFNFDNDLITSNDEYEK